MRVRLCAPAFLSLQLHVCSTCSQSVRFAAVVRPPVWGRCPVVVCCGLVRSVGVSPAWCLSPAFMDLLSLACATASLYSDPAIPKTGLGCSGSSSSLRTEILFQSSESICGWKHRWNSETVLEAGREGQAAFVHEKLFPLVNCPWGLHGGQCRGRVLLLRFQAV